MVGPLATKLHSNDNLREVVLLEYFTFFKMAAIAMVIVKVYIVKCFNFKFLRDG
jgi:hypothetical protein